MVGSDEESWLPRGWALVVVLVAGLAFWLPALAKAGGFPAPLDDVYIYYGFARSTAEGAPLAWLPENGVSSGATSVLYPLVLAPLWLIGLRGSWLGVGAALLAILCLADFAYNLGSVVVDARRRPMARLLAPLFVVACPLLDWSLFSGMETALFAAVLGRASGAADRALRAPADTRRRAQLVAGLWFACLPLARPEAALVAGCLAVAVVHGAGALSTWASLARTLVPLASTLGLQLSVNRLFTGEWKAAGAIRKLLTEQPRSTPSQLVLEYAKNLAVLAHQGFVRALGGGVGLLALGVLILAALGRRRRRRLALALMSGSLGMLLVVCLNSTARYQNYRYAAPSLLTLLATALLGLGALDQRRGAARALGAFAAACVLVAPVGEWSKQREHFARASRNIAEQHGEVARRLAALSPRPRRVLVGDAGAIPYLSGLPALDGLGLGGYHDYPFARASLEGDAAVVELIERMPIAERPDVMALYPGWWPMLTSRFGDRFDAVKIADNVICAADEKVLYRAKFSDLAMPDERAWPDALLELDLGDLVDEREHGVRLSPGSGRVSGETLGLGDGRLRWDAARRLEPGGSLDFRVPAHVLGARRLLVRVAPASGADAHARVELRREGSVIRSTELAPMDCSSGGSSWCTSSARLDARADDLISITSPDSPVDLYRLALTSTSSP